MKTLLIQRRFAKLRKADINLVVSLEVYTHINNIDDKNGTWQQIPDHYAIDMFQVNAMSH